MTEPSLGTQTASQRGEISKKAVTGVLPSGGPWIPIIQGTFDTCEINFFDDLTGNRVGGVVGFKFATKGINGRNALVFVSMQTIAAVQMEEPEESNGE
jgi:hypothetical protein